MGKLLSTFWKRQVNETECGYLRVGEVLALFDEDRLDQLQVHSDELVSSEIVVAKITLNFGIRNAFAYP